MSSAAEATRQFATINELTFGQRMPDGFRIVYEHEAEAVLVDGRTDGKLRSLVSTMWAYLSHFHSVQDRAMALAKLVVQRLGAPSIEGTEKFNDVMRRLRIEPAQTTNSTTTTTTEASNNNTGAVTVELGELIGGGAGLERHASILYKYLADRAGETGGGGGGIVCRLSRRWVSDAIRTDVQIRLPGGDHFIDLYGNPPRLLLENTDDARSFTTAEPSRPPQAAPRIAFRELLSSRVDHSATEFSTIWNGSRVFVRISESGQSYDASAFAKEADALATSLHPSIIRVRAVCVPEPSSSTSTTISNTISTSSSVATRATVSAPKTTTTPTLVAVRDPLEAQPLWKVIGGDRRRWTFERVLHVAVQLAEAMSELHLFGVIMGGDLHPANVLITPVGDVKVGDFRMDRYNTSGAVAASPPVAYRAPEHWETQVLAAAVPAPRPTSAITSVATMGSAATMTSVATMGSMKGDVYSFGCVVYALAVGSEVWRGMTDGEVKSAVLESRRSPASALGPECDGQIGEVIKRCLAYQPADRPTFDELATTLRAILDVAKKLVPVTQIAPFGFANLSDTNFGAVGPLSTGTSLVDCKDAVKLRQQLQPMSDDSVTLAREKFLSQLGTIDPYMIVAKRVDAPSFYVVHRANGNVALVTSGLWDPNELQSGGVEADGAGVAAGAVPGGGAVTSSADSATTSTAALPGMELLAEAKESEVPDLSNSWLYQCLLEVACTAKRNGPKLRRLLRDRQYATMEVMDVKLPPEFLDPTTGRACMLLGIEGKDVPRSFSGPNETSVVTVVTCRLLTLVQWRDSQEFAFGKRPLAARFVRDGTYHVSSIVVAQRAALPGGGSGVDRSSVGGGSSASPAPKRAGPELNPPRRPKSVRSGVDSGVRPASPDATANASIPPPDESWSIVELMRRVIRSQQPDGGVGATTTVTTAVAVSAPATASEAASSAANGGDVRGIKKGSAGSHASSTAVPVQYSSSVTAQLRSMPATTATVSLSPAVLDLTTPLVQFPPLSDVAEYEPPVPTGVIVSSLVTGGIAMVLSALTAEMRRILAPNSVVSEKLRGIAQTIFGALATQSQLYGWQHVSEYIRNPTLYIERTKSVSISKVTGGSAASATNGAAGAPTPTPTPTPRGPSELHEAVDGLQEVGHAIIKRLVQRIDWLRQIFAREEREIATEFLVELIGTDAAWMGDANGFMKGCEEKVAELLARNPQRFNQFRELQKKGVQWPHSPELRKEIEKAGFVFRPMMIRRDRCMCDVCGVEVSGWRPWHDIPSFHDYSKHVSRPS